MKNGQIKVSHKIFQFSPKYINLVQLSPNKLQKAQMIVSQTFFRLLENATWVDISLKEFYKTEIKTFISQMIIKKLFSKSSSKIQLLNIQNSMDTSLIIRLLWQTY